MKTNEILLTLQIPVHIESDDSAPDVNIDRLNDWLRIELVSYDDARYNFATELIELGLKTAIKSVLDKRCIPGHKNVIIKVEDIGAIVSKTI